MLVTSAQTTVPNHQLTVSQDDQPERAPQAVGVVSRTSLNFGPVLLDQASPHKTITLTNSGSADLNLANVSIRGNFALPLNHCAQVLKPGEHCNVEVIFTPHSLGPETGALSFTDNASNSPQTVSLKGVGSTTAPTKISVTAAPNTIYAGQAVTFTATIKSLGGGVIYDGEQVAFTSRQNLLGYGTLHGGVASLTTSVYPEEDSPEESIEVIVARYSGNQNLTASEGGAPLRFKKYKPTVTCSTSPNPSLYGQRVAKQGHVESEGYVSGYMYLIGLCSHPKMRVGESFLCKDMMSRHARSYQIDAYYLGNKYNTKGSGSCTHVINPTGTAIAIESSKNPSKQGQPVKLSVIVTAPYARPVEGSVTFMVGADTLGTVQLATARGHIITASLPPGENTITAIYNPPNGDYLTSSTSLLQVVK